MSEELYLRLSARPNGPTMSEPEVWLWLSVFGVVVLMIAYSMWRHRG